jgi:hypothetical protein
MNGEPDDDALDQQAKKILHLAKRSQNREWIVRRSSRISCLDEKSYRHTVHVFLNVERIATSVPTKINHPDVLLLPVFRLPRAQHVELSVSASGLGELNRMTMNEEREVVRRWLVAKWRDRVPGWALDYALELIRVDPRTEHLRDPLTPSQELLQDRLLTLGWLLQINDEGRTGFELPDFEIADFLGDVEGWYSEYLVIVEVPRQHLRAEGGLIEIGFVEGAPRRRFPALRRNRASDETRRAWLYRLCGSPARQLLGWVVAGSYSIPVRIRMRSNMGTARSSHVSFEAPPGFRAIDPKVMIDFGVDPRVRVEYPSDELTPERVHVHVDDQGLRVHNAEFRVSLLANKSGFPVQAMIASWLLGTLSWLGLASARYLQANGKAVPTTETFLLIIVPVVTTIVTQRDGERTRSRCFNLPRGLLTMSALGILVATGLLVFRYGSAYHVWQVSFVISCVASARLTFSFVNQWRKTSNFHSVRGREEALRILETQLGELRRERPVLINGDQLLRIEGPKPSPHHKSWELWPLADKADAPVVLGMLVFGRLLDLIVRMNGDPHSLDAQRLADLDADLHASPAVEGARKQFADARANVLRTYAKELEAYAQEEMMRLRKRLPY